MQDSFDLQIVVDFFDDVRSAPFTDRTFSEMMRLFASWGITRVYWNGQSYASGLYDAEVSPTLTVNARRTYDEVGEFIPAAVRHAHEHGLELFVEFKPFDMFFPLVVPHGRAIFTRQNTWRQGIPALGGSWQMGSIFPEQHPECLMARNMVDLRPGLEQEPIDTIKFVKDDDQPTDITSENLHLFVSRDNEHYRPYDGPLHYHDGVE